MTDSSKEENKLFTFLDELCIPPPQDAIQKVQDLLLAGADPNFIKHTSGTWGAMDQKPVLALALRRSLWLGPQADPTILLEIVRLLLQGGAAVAAREAERDWRGSGSSRTMLELALKLHESAPALPATSALVAEFLSRASEKALAPSRRSYSSMRSDGHRRSTLLGQALERRNNADGGAMLRALVARLGELGMLDEEDEEVVRNERGYDTETKNTAAMGLIASIGAEGMGGGVARSGIRALHLLLASGASAELISSRLVATKNPRFDEDGGDDPREDGYEPRHFSHRGRFAAAGMLARDRVLAEWEEGDAAALTAQPLVRVLEMPAGTEVATWLLRSCGCNLGGGGAAVSAVPGWEYLAGADRGRDRQQALREACAGFPSGSVRAVTFEGGKGRKAERAWAGEWSSLMFAEMGGGAQERILAAMCALRRFGVGGDVGEEIISFVLSMEIADKDVLRGVEMF
jgi:hypothetical protein